MSACQNLIARVYGYPTGIFLLFRKSTVISQDTPIGCKTLLSKEWVHSRVLKYSFYLTHYTCKYSSLYNQSID